MLSSLEVINMASAMARHATTKQSVTAVNIANVNTPGFKAKTVHKFADHLGGKGETTDFKVTRAGHMGQGLTLGASEVFEKAAMATPDGNTVHIEDEILSSVDAERQHSRAMAIYRHTMTMLKTSIGRG